MEWQGESLHVCNNSEGRLNCFVRLALEPLMTIEVP